MDLLRGSLVHTTLSDENICSPSLFSTGCVCQHYILLYPLSHSPAIILFHEGHTVDRELRKSRHWVLFIFVSPAFDKVYGTYFLGGSDSKESAFNAGDLDLIPELGSSPGERNSYPLQYSCLKNPMDRGAWQATVHRIAKSHTWLKQLSMHALTSLRAFIRRS